MKTLKSYVGGSWHEALDGFVPLMNPSTEEEIGRVSSQGLDSLEILRFAATGGAALRAMTFAQRGSLLKGVSTVLREHREELLDLSRENNGTTKPDGSFDVDGAGGALAFYAHQAKGLGDRQVLTDGEQYLLSKSGELLGHHVWVSRQGVAVHINAFNFPAWGLAEKLACALLGGMPVITKPASATALVAARWVEIVAASGILPAGALQMICGSTGDLLDHLGPQDVVAFTGSAETSLKLRQRVQHRVGAARFNVEADSLNAAVWGPDTRLDQPTGELFLREVVHEITQKAGQKCTAVRRILVPKEQIDEVQEALVARLKAVVTGNPAVEGVSMGPLATQRQLADAVAGVAALAEEAKIVAGTGVRCDGVGSPEGKGFFMAPTLLRVADGRAAPLVHQREVFAPVSTLVPYDGSSADAAEIVGLAGGTLVTSVYSDDHQWVKDLLLNGGSFTGRLYVGSEEMTTAAPGSGAAFPQNLHGGPGRAGGGEELGGLIGTKLYMQRLALQGGATLIDSI
jgi:3,4-dehydroadipyl-CoA semialdehyde dehydrogenase